MRRSDHAITTRIAVAMLGLLGANPVSSAPPTPKAPPAPPAPTAPAREETRRFSDALHALPPDVDAVVACRSVAKLRHTAAGAFVIESFAADALDPVRDGWHELARTIGLTPEQAFDAILGDRVVLALRRVDESLPDWTIQAHVAPQTEALLRDRLKVVPRTIVAGQTLYAVERGALELSVVRANGAAGLARIVLAPAGSPLFADILRARPGATPSVLDTPMGSATLDAPPGDILVLGRLRERADAWGALVGAVDDAVLTATVRGALSHSRPGAADTPGWDERQVRELARDSFVAVFDSRASALAEVGDVLGARLPERVRAALEGDEALTGREVALLAPDSSGSPAIVAGLELHEFTAGARLGDDAMDAMLEMVGTAPRGFGGVAPCAVRTVEEPGVSLAWAYTPAEPSRPDGRTWWVHTTDPASLSGARAGFVGLTPRADGLRAFATARPAAFARVLAARREPLPATVAAALERIESLEWVETDAPEKVLDARLVIRFAAPSGRR